MKLTNEETSTNTKGVLRIGVLNDIHYDPFYDPKSSSKSFCRSQDPFNPSSTSKDLSLEADKLALYGRFECDPNENLIKTIMGKMAKDYEIDVLLVNGDLVGHEIAVKAAWNLTEDKVEQHYEILKEILGTVSG